jgi:serine/threonine protein kinase
MESLTDEQRALFSHGGQLDDYEVLKPIGKGKFSVVFKAKRRRDGQAVALKKIAIFDMMNLKAREKTLKEVRRGCNGRAIPVRIVTAKRSMWLVVAGAPRAVG